VCDAARERWQFVGRYALPDMPDQGDRYLWERVDPPAPFRLWYAVPVRFFWIH
jgi:hypothetical protein